MTLKEQLLRDEGFRPKPYRDTRGYLTIGVGRNLDGKGISKDEAMELLDNDIIEVTNELFKQLPWTRNLTGPRFAALVNMGFQLGIKGLLKFPKMLLHVQHERWQEAHDEALKIYTAKHGDEWPEQTPERAKRIAKQILTGVMQ